MPESPISVTVPEPDALVLRIQADSLDEARLQRLQAEVRTAAAARPALPCLLDMAQVGFLPSLTLAALIRLRTEFRDRGQRLLLVGLQPQIRDVFVTTRLDRLFELPEDMATALRSIRAG